MPTRLRLRGRFLRLALCALPAACAEPAGEQPQDTRAFDRYALMHIGAEHQGFGGIYRIDAPDVQAGVRFTAQADLELRALWLDCRTVGAPGPLEVSVYAAPPEQLLLRELPAPLGRASFAPGAAASAAGWQRTPFTSAAKVPAGSIVHVVLQPAAGARYGAEDRVELVTARSRSPLQFLPLSRPGPGLASIADEALAFLYARNARSPLELLREVASNAAFVPIFAVEDARGDLYGQLCDVHREARIFGAHGYGQIVRLPGPLTFDFVAMYTRGAGEKLGERPSDDLYLEIVERDLASGACKPVAPKLALALRSDKLFKGRSHWFGRFLDAPLTLAGGTKKEYALILSSPAASGDGSDAWMFSAEGSTLARESPVPSFGMEDSRAFSVELGAELVFQPLGPATDAPFQLLRLGKPRTVGVLDEVQGCSIGADGSVDPAFPRRVRAGDEVQFTVTARNLGIATGQGGKIFARLVDRATGRILAGPREFPPVPENNERSELLAFPMPPSDLVLALEVGHLDLVGGSSMQVVDDVTAWEIRVR